MRNDIDLIITNSNLAVLRIGARYFKLHTDNLQRLKRALINIESGTLSEEDAFEQQLYELLAHNHGIENIDNIYSLFKSVGIDLTNLPKLSKNKNRNPR